MHKRIYEVFGVLSLLLLTTFSFIIYLNTQQTDVIVESKKVPLNQGRWNTREIHFYIDPKSTPIVKQSWLDAINTLNEYKIIKFTQSNDKNAQLYLTYNKTDETALGETRRSTFIHATVGATAWLTENKTNLRLAEGNELKIMYKTVAMHELGHVLGLAHDPNRHTLMNASDLDYFSKPDSRYLQGLRQIYK